MSFKESQLDWSSYQPNLPVHLHNIALLTMPFSQHIVGYSRSNLEGTTAQSFELPSGEYLSAITSASECPHRLIRYAGTATNYRHNEEVLRTGDSTVRISSSLLALHD